MLKSNLHGFLWSTFYYSLEWHPSEEQTNPMWSKSPQLFFFAIEVQGDSALSFYEWMNCSDLIFLNHQLARVITYIYCMDCTVLTQPTVATDGRTETSLPLFLLTDSVLGLWHLKYDRMNTLCS